ncbi:hypothetical protein [Agrococcus sp. Marseille-Q4369]|uniref:hypothetical protein n=1 Tax=Agrococcus sp. Marseille-Q4369 TaxID=2810513 RepID=UPI001B8CFEEC|nr:hypothetical protein [Agrococcus sp. Marseille-Q4369]QUW18887.1 hypothetical protein JSQ78_00435 [Agrococcus sp. Marseille-Q4369]
MHDHPTLSHVLDVALPLIPSRPRLRFVEGAAAGAAASDGPGYDDDADEPDEQESQEDSDDDSDGSEEQDEPDDEQQFDAAAAAERIRKKNRENANLRKRAKAAEDEAAANKGAADKVSTLEAENLRLRVALEHGLPLKLAKRLTGTTEEELLEDAQELLELTNGDKRKKPPTDQPKQRLRGGGDPTEAPIDETADTHKFASSVFDN